jgi:transposase
MKGHLAFHGPCFPALRQRSRHPRKPHADLLAAYSPELNSIERLWLYLEERFLSHRLWNDDDAVCKAWRRVTSDAGRTKSLCPMEWA